MISSRMLSVLQYMQAHPSTSYRELAEALQLKERSVRYDIDRINDALSVEGLKQIEKGAKGHLFFPEGQSLESLTKTTEFVYSSEERIALLLLTLLIRKEDFKINRMSRILQVSRSTVKSDVSELEAILEKEGLRIEYIDHFELVGPKQNRVVLLNYEFRKYISLLINPPRKINTFDAQCIQVIHNAFAGVSIPRVILCVDEMLEANRLTLTDDSYKWYLSNVIVLVWFIINGKEYPLAASTPVETAEDNSAFITNLAEIIGHRISEKNARILKRFLNCTNQFAHLYSDMDLVDAEGTVYALVNAVSKELKISFEQDSILIEGLLNHVIPLVNRIKNHVSLWDENMIAVLSDKDMDLFNRIRRICSELPVLSELESEDEVVYLTIYFLASIRRMLGTPYKNVLLVCGHGYGTTTMLRETLLNEYQVHIVDTIPVYKLTDYPNWNSVDCVLSTARLNTELPRPSVMVNPILKAEDYIAVEKTGISRKHNLSNYYAVEQKLGFLSPFDKKRVMDVIEKEFGYQTVTRYETPRDFSNLLKYDCIRMIDQPLEWREAVWEASKPLLERGFIDDIYVKEIINTMEKLGFYAISDGDFALLHGKEKTGVNQTCMSLMINRRTTCFGDKKVKIIFCLAAKNAKDHIPAIISLMRMVKKTPIIEKLENAQSVEEIYDIILRCEFETA